MNGIISTQDETIEVLQKKAQAAPNMAGQDLVKNVTCAKAYDFSDPLISQPNFKHNVMVIDFGAKGNICRELMLRNCKVLVVPATMSAKDILEKKPDGIIALERAGDPAAVKYAIETVRELVGKIPMFGICLGHQILGLALVRRPRK